MKNNILIIDTSNINKGVFKSHVFNLSQKLDSKNCILSLNSKKNIELLDNIFFNKVNSKLDFGWIIEKNNNVLTFSFYKKINQLIKQKNINILYCQNYLPSFLGLIFKIFNKNIKIHADIKGIVPEEHLLYDKGLKKYLMYFTAKIMEFFIFRYADSYSVVSNEFKKYFENKYNIKNKKIIILPSSLDHNNFYFDEEIRNKIRKKYNWESKEVLIYSGSMVEWQLPEKLFETMKNISENSENIIPIVLTLEVEKAEKFKKQLGFDKLIIKSCNGNSEVNEFLNAGDVAITIRKDDIVNNVSSPTKIAEYLYTKNKLILSTGIGDYSKLSEKYKGIYKIKDINKIDYKNINDFIIKDKFDDKIIDLIRNEYTLEANIAKINKLF